ncbi:MAG: tyrosine recombinase XerC [Tissierellia bacterium]|nr:tyrosine recombinase XerC [Tissierellia bacterium]
MSQNYYFVTYYGGVPLPIFLEDYLNYLITIRGLSEKTVNEYSFDLRTFLRFLMVRFKMVELDFEFDEIDISNFTINDLKMVKLIDLHAFIAYTDKVRNNSNFTKRRKITSLRTFFDYMVNTVNLLTENPSLKLETPKTEKRNPAYLTLEESKRLLLSASKEKNIFLRYRDYAILILFLNCGLRISELVSINLKDIKDNDTISIVGKGNKERVVYLNDACVFALENYIKVRPESDDPALFLSQRKTRLQVRSVQHRVEKHLLESGLDTNIFSTHKLRHTAATLMYKYGDVDILTLKEILGHESVATTQIYTHLDSDRLRDAVNSNPLAEINQE